MSPFDEVVPIRVPVPVAITQGTLALDLEPRLEPPPGRRRADRPPPAAQRGGVGPAIRPGRRRDRRRGPAAQSAAPVDHPDRVRRPRAPGPARGPGRRAPARPGPGATGHAAGAQRARVVRLARRGRGQRARDVRTRSRAVAARFALRKNRWVVLPSSLRDPESREGRAGVRPTHAGRVATRPAKASALARAVRPVGHRVRRGTSCTSCPNRRGRARCARHWRRG